MDVGNQRPKEVGGTVAQQAVFVWANVTALVVWIAALIGVRQGVVIAVFPLWFLGFAELLNFFLHPYLAFETGGYFPGVITAPLVGALGMMTVRELARITAKDPSAIRA